ncbi:iron-dicitrate transporter subunit FecD [Bacillus glycinifermentans]|uniref:Iron chelate uptake ABC transporter family permease subunit n=1 Tax=Bacillus glycinifermentans TaxID=1664069 RepID=A0A0J6E9Y7_9BACI|nr:iron chelate uptake ABC transporter family permease subunit [Bacillus glycinifermentans]ATH94967.1 iron-dicitrate transporter subunit FecD [Bacillus glycinifermentans]KMM57929.1 iron-dicitrate transporter subunit FecD [Bacillus glycinifermentans]KRT93157.1 iron-dicitrate transporter subunit FecD [Bacillus glycinifermentans]MEC0487671.1 iron chelate uptake ABC transporter family permease subunit [Bacillus glycinifermentans]MEC0495727.1 iron chelate uptake ABC transporter family permease subu
MNIKTDITKRQRRKPSAVLVILPVFLLLLAAANLMIGDEKYPLGDVIKSLAGQGDPGIRFMVMEFRMPRVILAVLAGGALAVAGVIAQSLMRNPLAAPDTLGITGGAGFGAVIVTVLFSEQSSILLTGAAFSGSIVAAVFVYVLAYRNGISPVRLALVGIAVNAFCHSGIQLLISRGSPNVNSALIWLNGSLWGRSWNDVLSLFIWCCLLIPPVWLAAKPLDIIKSGDAIATSVGVRLERTRFLLLAAAVILTAASVTAVGTIGFIGLMAPHIARRLAGVESRILIPVSGMVGSIILLLADSAGRGLIPPVEIPAGLIAAVIGGPYFIYLLRREAKRSKT